MITQILGTNIKGLSFAQDIGDLNLFLGKNGSGKSARAQALILALLGYIPGTAKKTNADILDNYGTGDKLVVGIKINTTVLERGFVRKNGKVSQGFKVNGKPVKEAEFSKALGVAGAPLPIDISAFTDLSDAKKIDFIFDLYPPDTDISQITADIETTKSKINTLTANAEKKEGAAEQLTTARAAMQLPMGTLADIESQIKDTESQLAQARQELKDAQIETAKAQAAADEKKRIEEQAAEQKKKDEETKRRNELKEQAKQLNDADIQKAPKTQATEMNQPTCETRADSKVSGPATSNSAVMDQTEYSLTIVLKALEESGCKMCAARLVAIRELKKYQKQEAA